VNPISRNIEVKRKARYYTNELSLETVETVWFILHGYGQLAGNFIKKFPALDNSKNYLVAPEALSRFYTDNGFGKIGASWMTKEERENEIEDYVSYLNRLYGEIEKELNGRKVKLNVFAFSQGTSTACRWLQKSGIKADKLILWGGFLPPDFLLGNWKKVFDSLLIVAGKEDDFLSPEKIKEGKKVLDKYSVDYFVHTFDGGHEMKEKVVNEVLSLL
jgi:predicted esterase